MGAFDLFGGGFFSSYPMTLPVGADGEPEFAINSVWLIAKLIYLLTGIGIIAANGGFSPRVKRA